MSNLVATFTSKNTVRCPYCSKVFEVSDELIEELEQHKDVVFLCECSCEDVITIRANDFKTYQDGKIT